LEACSDGIDNDGNGYTDCEDWSCSKSTDKDVLAYCESIGENTFEKCSDGIDNDGNGYIDCADWSCSRAEKVEVRRACQESAADDPAGADEACSNGLDDDADGFIDCDDWDCSHNPDVTVCGNGPRVCE
jgi:hypothetical protein